MVYLGNRTVTKLLLPFTTLVLIKRNTRISTVEHQDESTAPYFLQL